MVKYIQTTNRNSFTSKVKKYKKLRNDIWGRLAIRNKKNSQLISFEFGPIEIYLDV